MDDVTFCSPACVEIVEKLSFASNCCEEWPMGADYGKLEGRDGTTG
jgi:hypothetical protein